MSKAISIEEWSLRRSSFEGRKEELRIAQQRIFRVFQSLARQDMDTAAKYVADGVALDVPLVLDEAQPESVPNASQWRPSGGAELSSITLVGWAAANGDKDVVIWLLRRGAEPAQTFSGNRDAAWLAMEQGHDDIHKLLIERGCAPGLRIKDPLNTTRLIAATALSNLNAVRHILAKKPQVNAFDVRGRTALHYNLSKQPYREEDVEIGRLLLEMGGNPNMEDLDGVPPHILNQSPEAVSLLQGHELRKVSLAHAAKQPAVVEPLLEDIVPEPDFPDPPMPRAPKPPRRL